MRQILKAHSKTPIEALYLELGCKPIRFHLISRRTNFLHYLLNLEKTDLLFRFFEAQMKNPTKGDWILQVLDDLKELEISSNLDDIKLMSKDAFKSLVKNKSKVSALKYLNKLKSGHSKMENLMYDKIEIQTYLTSSNIHTNLAKQLFRWRTRMTNFKCNFKNGNLDLSCELGCKGESMMLRKTYSNAK